MVWKKFRRHSYEKLKEKSLSSFCYHLFIFQAFMVPSLTAVSVIIKISDIRVLDIRSGTLFAILAFILMTIGLAWVKISLSSEFSTLKPQAYNKQANTELKRIQVLAMPQANVRFFVFNAVRSKFGLIGTLTTEANRNGKENWLQDKVKADQFNQFESFRSTFNQEMTDRGYSLSWPEPLTQTPKLGRRDKFGLLKRYSAVLTLS
jgi:hypothetical protein